MKHAKCEIKTTANISWKAARAEQDDQATWESARPTVMKFQTKSFALTNNAQLEIVPRSKSTLFNVQLYFWSL